MENIPPKNAANGIIRALDVELSRRICTGQVIVSLAGACRELVDNAIDAGATNIEIRVIDNGLECLEVIDNGPGISSSNFEQLCKAHSTSKLSGLDDFRQLTSFGFRGEALNALAALGNVQITTRDATSRCATRLTFGHNGEQLSTEQCSRSQGTTVRVAHLFKPLPVRRAEFQRQARREFLRLVTCVQAFALASPSCRFTCTNSVNGGKRLTVLHTPGGLSTRLPQVLDSLFGGGDVGGGGKSNGGLLLLDETVGMPSDECLQLYGVPTTTPTAEREKIFAEIKLSGYVSGCQMGHGRSSTDRQFVFVNQRHVDFSKLCRIANEVYAQFNRGRFCCLVLFVDVPPHTLDVNISPDKRTVFLHHEKEVFAKLRATLFATFAKCQGDCSVPAVGAHCNDGSPEAKKRRTAKVGSLLRWRHNENGKTTVKMEEGEDDDNQLRTLTADQTADAGQTTDDDQNPFDDRHANFPIQTQQSVDLSCMAFGNEMVDQHDDDQLVTDDFEEQLFDQNSQSASQGKNIGQPRDTSDVGIAPRNGAKRRSSSVKLPAGQKALEAFAFRRLRSAAALSTIAAEHRSDEQQQTHTIADHQNQLNTVDQFRTSTNQIFEPKNEPPNSQKADSSDAPASAVAPAFDFVDSPQCCSFTSYSSSSGAISSQCLSVITAPFSQQQSDCDNDDDDGDVAMFLRPQQTVQVDMHVLRQNFANRCAQQRSLQQRMRQLSGEIVTQPSRLHVTTAAAAGGTEADEEEDKEAVERRLSMMLNKDDFGRMRLIGQFNNAFIIVRLRSHVFIVDQHAADEKYNFERLLAQNVLKSQRLIRPQRLRLGSVNAALMRDNLRVFRANGFDFQFGTDDAPPLPNANAAELMGWDRREDGDDYHDDCDVIIDNNLANGDTDDADIQVECATNPNAISGIENVDVELGTVLLTAVPVLHGCQLNRDDIDQLLSMLAELPGTLHRPTKVRKIFASKACRHSVMFGKALTQREMETIILNMGSMDQPWNCPHGRPTVRHLCTVVERKELDNNNEM